MPDYNRDAERQECEILAHSDRPAYRMLSESRTPTPQSTARAEARPNELCPMKARSRAEALCATATHLNRGVFSDRYPSNETYTQFR